MPVPSTFDFGLTVVTATGTASGRSATAPLYITGAWSMLGHDTERTSDQPNDHVLSEEVTPGKPYRMSPYFVYSAAAPIDSSPAVADQLAFVGDNSGTLSAIHIGTGGLAWSATVGGAVSSSPAVDTAGKLVVVGSSNDTVSAYAEKTGKLVWTVTTGGPVRSSPVIYGGVVYIGAGDHKLYAIAENTGKVAWTATVAGPVEGSPAFDPASSTVVVGDGSGTVTAFRVGARSPSRRWHVSVGGAVENSPVIALGGVFVGSKNGTVSSLSGSTGARRWWRWIDHVERAASGSGDGHQRHCRNVVHRIVERDGHRAAHRRRGCLARQDRRRPGRQPSDHGQFRVRRSRGQRPILLHAIW